MFYKILKDSKIIDAMETVRYVRQNLNNKSIISCTEEIANGIVSSDQSTIWHLEGMPEFSSGEYDTISLVEINEDEYNTIKEVLSGGTTEIDDDEEVRTPLTTTAVMEALDKMQDEIEALKEENATLKAKITTLEG